jgi:hypothetical protein
MADWLESYAKSLEINVWTSATVTSAQMVAGKWETTILLKNGTKNIFSADHLGTPSLAMVRQNSDIQ